MTLCEKDIRLASTPCRIACMAMHLCWPSKIARVCSEKRIRGHSVSDFEVLWSLWSNLFWRRQVTQAWIEQIFLRKHILLRATIPVNRSCSARATILGADTLNIDAKSLQWWPGGRRQTPSHLGDIEKRWWHPERAVRSSLPLQFPVLSSCPEAYTSWYLNEQSVECWKSPCSIQNDLQIDIGQKIQIITQKTRECCRVSTPLL